MSTNDARQRSRANDSEAARTAATPSERHVTASDLRAAIVEKLFCMQARFPEVATRHDYYLALAYAVRDLLLHKWIDSAHTYFLQESRTVVYLSAEYLVGP